MHKETRFFLSETTGEVHITVADGQVAKISTDREYDTDRISLMMGMPVEEAQVGIELLLRPRQVDQARLTEINLKINELVDLTIRYGEYTEHWKRSENYIPGSESMAMSSSRKTIQKVKEELRDLIM